MVNMYPVYNNTFFLPPHDHREPLTRRELRPVEAEEPAPTLDVPEPQPPTRAALETLPPAIPPAAPHMPAEGPGPTTHDDTSATQRALALTTCEALINHATAPSCEPALVAAQHELAHPDTSNHPQAYRILETLVRRGHTPAYEPAFAAAQQSLLHEDASSEHRLGVLLILDGLMQQGHAPDYAVVLAVAQRELDLFDTSHHYMARRILEALVRKGHVASYQPTLVAAQRTLADDNTLAHFQAYQVLEILVRKGHVASYPPALAAAEDILTYGEPLDHPTAYRLLETLARKGDVLSYEPALTAVQQLLAHPDRPVTHRMLCMNILDALVSQKHIPAYNPVLAVVVPQLPQFVVQITPVALQPHRELYLRIFKNLVVNKHLPSRKILFAMGGCRGTTTLETIFSELLTPSPPELDPAQ